MRSDLSDCGPSRYDCKSGVHQLINDSEYVRRSVAVAGWRAQHSEINRDVRRLVIERSENRQLNKYSKRSSVPRISDRLKAESRDRCRDSVDRVCEDACHLMPLEIS